MRDVRMRRADRSISAENARPPLSRSATPCRRCPAAATRRECRSLLDGAAIVAAACLVDDVGPVAKTGGSGNTIYPDNVGKGLPTYGCERSFRGLPTCGCERSFGGVDVRTGHDLRTASGSGRDRGRQDGIMEADALLAGMLGL